MHVIEPKISVLEKTRDDVSRLLSLIFEHEKKARDSFNLTPSENILSPLARLPFLLDSHTRYFLDDLRLFNTWCFPNGEKIGQIEQEILIPLLKEMTSANYVNVRSISGMNCMLIALAAMTKPGDTIFSIPTKNGGHASTRMVSSYLNLNAIDIPFLDDFDIDYEKLAVMLKKFNPSLIYIDQATFLFPIDPNEIRILIDRISPTTKIHYDSSHINGLILGHAFVNPLKRGAHCFGGSTHKTFPGPHKGFLVTNDEEIAKSIQTASEHLVSHHHSASIISLAISLLEFKYCHGSEYARRVINNTQKFANLLSESEFFVARKGESFTKCHQLWCYPKDKMKINTYHEMLRHQGIIINKLNGFPGINHPAYRISLSEFTRLGAREYEVEVLANIMISCLKRNGFVDTTREELKFLKKTLSYPKYCFDMDFITNIKIENNEFSDLLSNYKLLIQSIFERKD